MNPLLTEAAESIRLGWVLGVVTVLFVASFVFWIWWAWSGKNRARWEADSRLPLNDGGES
jgi:cbb3-type cytochrome oxidase subunit 3